MQKTKATFIRPYQLTLWLMWINWQRSYKLSEKNRQAYPSDLTDAQWELIEPLYSNMRVDL